MLQNSTNRAATLPYGYLGSIKNAAAIDKPSPCLFNDLDTFLHSIFFSIYCRDLSEPKQLSNKSSLYWKPLWQSNTHVIEFCNINRLYLVATLSQHFHIQKTQ